MIRKLNRRGRHPGEDSKRDDPGARRYSGDFYAKWFGGAFAPAFLLSLAVLCWLRRSGTLPGRYGRGLSLRGTAAVALGFAWLGLAVFLHSHLFLANTRSMWKFADSGRATGLIVFLFALAYVAYRVLAQ